MIDKLKDAVKLAETSHYDVSLRLKSHGIMVAGFAEKDGRQIRFSKTVPYEDLDYLKNNIIEVDEVIRNSLDA